MPPVAEFPYAEAGSRFMDATAGIDTATALERIEASSDQTSRYRPIQVLIDLARRRP